MPWARSKPEHHRQQIQIPGTSHVKSGEPSNLVTPAYRLDNHGAEYVALLVSNMDCLFLA
jgi:hypothetical protein